MLVEMGNSYVWREFRSWLRTMDKNKPPSELVVAYVLRDSLFDFLAVLAKIPLMRKFMMKYWNRDGALTYEDVAYTISGEKMALSSVSLQLAGNTVSIVAASKAHCL